MTTINDTVKNRIRKLLAQAKDREGTPEGGVFQEKAFDLLARYGLTEFDVEDGQDDLGADLVEEFEVEGSYRIERQFLLACIADALGCVVVRYRGSGRIRIAGTRRNVERTCLLFDSLVLHMITEAGKLRGCVHGGGTTQQIRHSFMLGYGSQIGKRLSEIENQVREEVRESGAALVPVDEKVRANQLIRQDGTRVARTRSRSSVHSGGYESGQEGANRADLGQTRVKGRKALTQ